FEIRDEPVDRGPDVGGRLARTERRALREDRRLGRAPSMLGLGHELDLDGCLRTELAIQLRELRLRVRTKRRSDLNVASLDLKPHRTPPVVDDCRFDVSARPGRTCHGFSAGALAQNPSSSQRGARANVTTWTSRAPAARSAEAPAPTVAPVV